VSKKLKLDLHCHVFEQFLPVSVRLITESSVQRLIEKVKSAGLDGVAITEHDNKEYGYRVKEIVDRQFGGEIIIIPGREVDEFPFHFVELDLAFDGKTSFRFIAHPGYPGNPSGSLGKFGGIEIENALHNWHIDKPLVRDLASRNNLVLLSNSDAHYLRDVGRCYSEVSLEDLRRPL
jgi:hypothetical protein